MFRVFGNSVNRYIHLEIHVFSTTEVRRQFLTKKKNNERLHESVRGVRVCE
jgi:hypothetical protein